jgi:hypothetical protein
MMRGKVSKIFTENVTHLVTNEVGSQKYHVSFLHYDYCYKPRNRLVA